MPSPPSPSIPLPKDGEELLDLRDLSLSDLNLPDTPRPPRPSKPFSLFADSPDPPVASASHVSHTPPSTVDDDVFSEPNTDQVPEDVTVFQPKSKGSRTRDDRLETELFELRELNSVFSGYLSALESARDHNSRLAAQVDRTNALLDKYVAVLGQAQYTQELVMDPEWQGADADELAVLEQQQRQREERAQAAREEKERTARAEQERIAKAEREEREREQREKASGSGRGRGRGRVVTRGVTRGRAATSTSSRGRAAPTAVNGTSRPRPSILPRPSSTTGPRGTRKL